MFHANTFSGLKQHVISYRKQNRLEELEEIDIILEHYLCTLPENLGKCEERDMPKGFGMYLKGGLALVKMLLFKQVSPMQIAEARAAQCVKCPFNTFPDKVGFPKWASDVAEKCTNGKKTTKHEELGECGVCGCNLRAKVFYGGKIDLTEEEKVKMKTVNCWQLNNGK